MLYFLRCLIAKLSPTFDMLNIRFFLATFCLNFCSSSNVSGVFLADRSMLAKLIRIRLLRFLELTPLGTGIKASLVSV